MRAELRPFAEFLARSIRVLSRQPGLAGPRLAGNSMWAMVAADVHAYGYNPATARAIPTAREIAEADVVETWLAWLRRHKGTDAVRLLYAWAWGVPAWRLADTARCSERTIRNRVERHVALILETFRDERVEVEVVEEAPVAAGPMAVRDERPAATDRPAAPAKVWVDGVGWVKNGRSWDDGTWRVDRHARRR